MPTRPRSHQLEDESHAALQQVLAPVYLYRRETPDYSVDGEVERFDDDGLATGLRFYVQVKATDEPDLDKSLKVNITHETVEYYRGLPLPLLMVRFHSATGRSFARWIHEFDPYYGGLNDKSITFTWTERDELTVENRDRLGNETEAFLALRSAALALPMKLYLETSFSSEDSTTASEVLFSLRNAIPTTRDILEFMPGDAPDGAVRLLMSSDQISGRLGLVSSGSMEIDPDDWSGDLGELVADGFIMLALAFENIGQSDIASRLAEAHFAESRLAAVPEVTLAITAAFGRSRRLLGALHVADALESSGHQLRREASETFMLPVVREGKRLNGSERGALVAYFEKRIANLESDGRETESGRCSYNLANFLRGIGEHQVAVSWFERAAIGEPDYLERAYFWMEKAGSLFGHGRYGEAAAAYEKAFELGKTNLAVALGADSVMRSGNYVLALEKFRQYNDLEWEVEGAEWRLKQLFLEFLVEQVEVDHEERDPELAVKIMEEFDFEASAEEEIADGVEEALVHDSLCGSAWFALGRLHLDQEMEPAAFIDYLGAALCSESEPESWLNTFLLSFADDGRADYANDVLFTAVKLAGAGFRTALVRWCKQQPSAFPKDQFLADIDDTISAIENQRQSFTMRVSGSDGQETIQLEQP